MPTVNGSWNPSSTANFRWRLILDYTVGTPSPADSSVTVSGTVRVQVGYGIQWNGASFSWSGSLLGSGSASKNVHVSTGGTIQIHTFSTSVPITSSAGSRTVSFSLWGVNLGSLGTARVSATIPIPARPAVPVPGSVSITRVSQTRVRVTWTGGAAHGLEVRRAAVAGETAGAWNRWEVIGTNGVARSSGVEFNVIPGYEWQAAVRRQAGGVWSSFGYSSNRARLFNAPGAPSSMTVTRVADNRHEVAWVFTENELNPATNFRIERYRGSLDAYDWNQTTGKSSRVVVDTTNLPDEKLSYRVRAGNAAGASAWTYPPAFVYTTPAAPTNAAAARSGPTSVNITWTINARFGASQTVQQQTSSDGGATWSGWSDVPGHVEFSAASTSRSVTGLDAAFRYRFRVATNVPGPLSSYSGATGIIAPAAKPNPPSLLAPSGVVSSIEDVQFRWRHNPADESDQTAYELQYRAHGDPTWTTLSEASTNVQTRDVAIPVTDLYEWRVRTKGQHADWSDWSTVGPFEVLNPPSVTILTPPDGGTHPSNRAEVVFDFSDGSGAAMTGWRAELHGLDGMGGGELLEQRSGTGAVSSVSFPVTVLNNFADYAIWVWVTSGTGLESAVAITEFSTDFLPPTQPILTGQWIEEEGLARLGVENLPAEPPDTVDTVHNRIERSINLGQTWETIADDMPLFVGLEDDMVPLNTRVLYRAVAVSEWDTEAVSEILELDTTTDKLWLMTMGSGVKVALECGLQLDPTFEQERLSEQYYGRPWPYSHYGEHRVVQVTVSATWAIQGIPCNGGIGTANDPHDLFGQDLWYRDPAGRAFRAGFTSGITLAQDNHWVQTVGFTVERVQV